MILPRNLILVLLALPLMTSAQQPLIDSLTKLSRSLPRDTQQAVVLRELAFTYLQSDPGRSLELAADVKAISQEKHFAAGIAMAYDIEGNALRTRGEYNSALNKHLAALRIFDSLHDPRYRSVLVNTATDHAYMKNYNQALVYYKKALQITSKTDLRRYLTILNNIGSIYNMQKRNDEAIKIYQEALPLAQADSTYKSQATLYSSLAIAIAENGDLDKGTEYMLQALHFQQLAGDEYHFASSSSTLGGFYIEQKKYALAEKYLEQAIEVASKIGAKSIIANYYRNKAHLYHRMGRQYDAYTWLTHFIAANDSLINEAHVAEMAESEARFNLERKDREMELLNADKALKESELKQQTLWKYVFLLLLVMILLVLFFVYRNMQLRKKANLSLEAENALLQKENILAQYETLRNQVNPHFLFNSLNALASLIRNDPHKASEFTAVFSRLYRQVLELKGHSVISLAEELQVADDYVYLQKIRFGNNLVLSKNIDVALMDRVLPPFCLQMLIENAIKHNIVSDERPLNIRISTEGESLLVVNNLQPRLKTESTGTGIRNITERFRIIHDILPAFNVVDDQYIAKVPLISA